VNPNPVHRFEKGNTAHLGHKGPQRRTLVKREIRSLEKLQHIDDVKQLVLENWVEMLNSKDPKIRLTATVEISQYLMPKKSVVESNQPTLINLQLGPGLTIPTPAPQTKENEA
jgi:hypothetical protein